MSSTKRHPRFSFRTFEAWNYGSLGVVLEIQFSHPPVK